MKDREERIEWFRNYCVHYKPRGSKIECTAGAEIDKLQRVRARPDGLKWAPCIEGHLLENACALCPHWQRKSREDGEKYADQVEADLKRMTIIAPVVGAWREKEPRGKAEVIECPACKGRLHLSQSAYNGHVHGQCETPGCVSWME